MEISRLGSHCYAHLATITDNKSVTFKRYTALDGCASKANLNQDSTIVIDECEQFSCHYLSRAVLPDVRIKCSPNVSKSCPNSGHFRVVFFKIA